MIGGGLFAQRQDTLMFNETIEGFELEAVAARQAAVFAEAGVPLPG